MYVKLCRGAPDSVAVVAHQSKGYPLIAFLYKNHIFSVLYYLAPHENYLATHTTGYLGVPDTHHVMGALVLVGGHRET